MRSMTPQYMVPHTQLQVRLKSAPHAPPARHGCLRTLGMQLSDPGTTFGPGGKASPQCNIIPGATPPCQLAPPLAGSLPLADTLPLAGPTTGLLAGLTEAPKQLTSSSRSRFSQYSRTSPEAMPRTILARVRRLFSPRLPAPPVQQQHAVSNQQVTKDVSGAPPHHAFQPHVCSSIMQAQPMSACTQVVPCRRIAKPLTPLGCCGLAAKATRKQ